MESKIFALLVGIGTYDKKSDVPSLKAPPSDVDAMNNLLRTIFKCPENNIEQLINAEATRVRIIKHFQSHLIDNPNIKPGDTVIFYYSGHGSQAGTADEFEKFEPRNFDETIVCYDSRISGEGHYDLADKELAALMAKVKAGVQIILIADACHSGGVNRSDEEENQLQYVVRQPPSRITHPRPLDSYLLAEDRFYLDMNPIAVPNRAHIKLAACQSWQKAYEIGGEGLFTSHLVHILTKTNGHISYHQLQTYLSTAINNSRGRQLPDIDLPVNFDPTNTFIFNRNIQEPYPLTVVFKNNQWRLNYGAIYGLPTDEKMLEYIRVAVYKYDEYEEENIFMGNFKLSEVKLKEAYLNYDDFLNQYKALSANLVERMTEVFKPKRETYKARLILPPNLTFSVKEGAKKKELLNKYFDQEKYPFIGFSSLGQSANYQIDLRAEDKIVIVDTIKKEDVVGCQYEWADGDLAAKFIFTQLAKIEAWKRLISLDNEKEPAYGLRSKIDIKFENHLTNRTCDDREIDLRYGEENIPFSLKISNRSKRSLFIGILHFSRFFGISTIAPNRLFSGDNTSEIVMLSNQKLCIRDEVINETIDVFKVIVSTEPFDDFKFAQKDMPIGELFKITRTRSSKDDIDVKKHVAEETWFAQNITVKLKRSLASGRVS